MEENTIKLSKNNLLRLKITTDKGEDTGNYLEFDLEDIGLSLRYQDMLERDKKNKDWLQKEFIIINKREDVKGKKLLSKNEEDKLKAINKFFKEEVEIYNMFLGDNGVQKLLNGKSLGWTSLAEIDDIITNQILPYFEKSIKDIEDKVMEKYGTNKKEVLQ